MARYPPALWRPTPKHGYAGNYNHLHQGVVIHSAEGGAAGLLSVLDDPNRQASWHFHVLKSGIVYQLVDTDNIAWTNGSQQANEKFWGIEMEGGGPGNPGEPLTQSQYRALLALVKWLWDTHGLSVFERQRTAWEHNEMTRFGAASTSCPSGRIPWDRLIADMEDDMTDAEYKALIDKLDNLETKVENVYNRVDEKAGAVHNEVQEQASAVADIVRDEVGAIPGGGGSTPDEIKEAVKEAHREGTG